MSKKKDTGYTFSCLSCGTPYTVYPPDTFLTEASLDKGRLDKPVKMTYYCTNCKKENVLYWGQRIPFAMVG
jgi:DNA-directed RNA polymerase subunit RPC12/RpoP